MAKLWPFKRKSNRRRTKSRSWRMMLKKKQQKPRWGVVFLHPTPKGIFLHSCCSVGSAMILWTASPVFCECCFLSHGWDTLEIIWVHQTTHLRFVLDKDFNFADGILFPLLYLLFPGNTPNFKGCVGQVSWISAEGSKDFCSLKRRKTWWNKGRAFQHSVFCQK